MVSSINTPTGTEGTTSAPMAGKAAPKVVPASAAHPAAIAVYLTVD